MRPHHHPTTARGALAAPGRATAYRRATAAVGAALLVAGIGAAGCSSSSTASADAACAKSAPKMTLHATGQADAPPDLLTVAATVDVTGPTARQALHDNNTRTAALTSALKAGGVAAKDVQTSGLTVQPQYAYPKGQPPRLTGYQVTDQVTAKLRDLDKAGAVIDGAAGAAGDAIRINSLTFSIDDPSGLQDAARANAIKDLVPRAKAAAEAGGQHLGQVCSITDQAPPTPASTALGYDAVARSNAGPQAAQVPLEQGSVDTNATVTVVWALRD